MPCVYRCAPRGRSATDRRARRRQRIERSALTQTDKCIPPPRYRFRPQTSGVRTPQTGWKRRWD